MISPPTVACRRRPASLKIEQLEVRNMLAGVVQVVLADNDLVVRGDELDNHVLVDLNATTLAGAVQGLDDTQIVLANRSGSLPPAGIQDIRIRMLGGDDQLVMQAGDGHPADRLFVALGQGDDALALLGDSGSAIAEDIRIRGQRGKDLVFVSGLMIANDLWISGGRNHDTLAVDSVTVDGRTRITGRRGNDVLLACHSVFRNDLIARGGWGSDSFGFESCQISDRMVVSGRRGNDSLWQSGLELSDRGIREVSIENHPTGGAVERARAAGLQPFQRWLFDVVDGLPSASADRLHDAVAGLSEAYGVDLVTLDLDPDTQRVSVADPTPGISVLWDQAVQEAVINTGPGPTIASRAHAMVHTAMFDAWSAYDQPAASTRLADTLQRPAAEDTDTHKREAMSFAAYRVLDDLFSSGTAIFDALMDQLGYDPDNLGTDPATPAGIGNRMAAALLDYRHGDGANQLGDHPDGNGTPYGDTSGYTAVNGIGNPDRMDLWTPEYVPIDAAPGTGNRIQEFLTPHWGGVAPFALSAGGQFRPEAPQPFLLVEGTHDLDARTITLADGTVLEIDRSLVGTVINPAFVAQAEEVVQLSASLTDEQKLIAEFWEDGGGTSFPPGTFMTFAQFVSARDNHSLDEDARLFFAMGNAVFDAGIATWEAKTHYDYVRPVRAIRELGELGLIGEFDAGLGGYAIEAWTPDHGTGRILASEFLTYQTPGSDPSPPFAEYTSGHSAFSAAGAAILSLFTGNDRFGASVTFAAGSSRFEPGSTPGQAVTLAWATFGDAADESGLSRLFGGIHFVEGDLNGRTLGREVAQQVWSRVQDHINGTI